MKTCNEAGSCFAPKLPLMGCDLVIELLQKELNCLMLLMAEEKPISDMTSDEAIMHKTYKIRWNCASATLSVFKQYL